MFDLLENCYISTKITKPFHFFERSQWVVCQNKYGTTAVIRHEISELETDVLNDRTIRPPSYKLLQLPSKKRTQAYMIL